MQNHNIKLKILKFFFVALTFNFALSTFNLSVVHAQQAILSLSPPLVELLIKPEKSAIIAYTFENAGDPGTVQFKILPFQPDGKNGAIMLKKDIKKPILFSLENKDIRLENPVFFPSKKSQQIVLRIQITSAAQHGDYYYALLAETQPLPAADGTSSSQTRVTIGTNLLITVTDTEKTEIKGSLAELDISGGWRIPFFGKKIRIVDSSDIIRLILVAQNQGNNFIKARGTITANGFLAREKIFTLTPQNILAQSQRTLTSDDIKLAGWYLGKQTVTAHISFGDVSQTQSSSISFFAFPFKVSLIVILPLIMIAVLLKRMK